MIGRALRGVCGALFVMLLVAAPALGATSWLKSVGSPAAALFPSDVLPAISGFNITEPVNASGELFNNNYVGGATYPGDCTDQTLNASRDSARSTGRTVSSLVGYTSPWFYASGGAVFFRSPTWGATTSTNTKTARSELRSLVQGAGASTGEFRLSHDPVFRVAGSVIRRANGGGNVHVMQFHPDSADVFIIVSFTSTGGLRSELTSIDQATKTTVTLLASGAPLGTEASPTVYDLTATVDSANSQILWSGTANGSAVSQTQPYEPGWNSIDMYGKAGAYGGSSASVLCSGNAAAAIGNGYLLPVGNVTDYYQTAITVLSLTLANPSGAALEPWLRRPAVVTELAGMAANDPFYLRAAGGRR